MCFEVIELQKLSSLSFLLLCCFTYWTAEAALPGEACSNNNFSSNLFCCNRYCSAFCNDTHCPKGDYCILQNPPPSAGLKYLSCFPGDHVVFHQHNVKFVSTVVAMLLLLCSEAFFYFFIFFVLQISI